MGAFCADRLGDMAVRRRTFGAPRIGNATPERIASPARRGSAVRSASNSRDNVGVVTPTGRIRSAVALASVDERSNWGGHQRDLAMTVKVRRSAHQIDVL